MTSDKDVLIKALSPLLKRVRTDVTAVKKANGESAWTREPLTKVMVAKHLNGGPARGTSFIKAGQSVTLVGGLDFDSHKGLSSWPDMVDAARAVYLAGLPLGLRPIPFRSSGGRGIHLYYLFDQPQDAYTLRATLTDVLAAAGFTNGTKGVAAGQVEVFPKQDEVPIDGFGNQMILPLADKSVPLDIALDFAPMTREWTTAMSWPTCAPLPQRERPTRLNVAASATPTVPLEVLRSAAAAIPNEGDNAPDYDHWHKLVCAIWQGTGGSDDGLELAIEFSARNPLHNEKFLRERVWPFIKDRAGGTTHKTLLHEARKAGWVEPHALYFDNLDAEFDGEPAADAPPGSVVAENAPQKALAKVRPPADLPGFLRDKQNQIPVTMPNLLRAVACEALVEGAIGFDSFRDEIMFDDSATGQWRPFTDHDYVWVRDRLERFGFKPIGRETIRDAVAAIASRNTFDSAQLWLSRLTWDGVPRVETFLSSYLSTEDSPYTRAVSRYTWTALAGRVNDPGCKADMVPIAIGVQGAGKSSAVAAMVPGPEFCVGVNFNEKDDDMARKMRGRLIAEFGELHGFHTRAMESIKEFITRQHEKWVPKFKEFATSFPRRLLFFGTTNNGQFLADDTGNRRWLPFYTGIVDVARIRRDHLQLWAEAAMLHRTWGVMWEEAEHLARLQHADHEIEDAWDERVAGWLDTPGFGDAPKPRELPYLTTSHVLVGALSYDIKNLSRKEEMRMASVLRRLGYSRSRVREGGRQFSAFVNTCEHPENTLTVQGVHTVSA
jgi:predicted P-loop ATPase